MARKTSTRRGRRFGLVLVAALAALALGTVARADDISNNLDDSVDAVAEVMPLSVGGANGTTTLLVVPRGDDGKNGCNLTGSTTLVVSISSSNTSVATLSPSSTTFTSCGFAQLLTVTPHNQGTATISVSQTSNNTGATFNFAPATFTVNVAPPPNTPPQVVVAGVTGGANYPKDSVPSATCQVTDAEDGNSSFPATLSTITGLYASDGIGSQTASCSYTDAGGALAQASKTYNILDPSAPGIQSNVVGTLGTNDWYVSDVTLDWTVTEGESPNSLQTTGCGSTSITADQASTPYICSATSAGGSASKSVSIKRDATPPTISGSASPVANLNGWNNTDVAVTFTCGDGLSGIDSCGPDKTLTDEAAGQSVAGSALDNAGNSAGASVGPINIDKTAPNVAYTSASPGPNSAGWHNTDVVATFTAADGLSGFGGPSSTTTGTATTSGEGAAVTVGSPAFTDLAGNTVAAGAATSDAFKIDKTPPSIGKVSLKTADGSDYTPGTWTNQSVTATFSCTDQAGLSGAKDALVIRTVSASGADQTASAFCEDNAGNKSGSESYSNIDIDKVAPTIVASAKKADGSAYTGDWTNQTVTVSFTCNDALAGVAPGDCPVDVVVGGDTAAAGTNVSQSVSDRAGNSTTSNVINVQLDKSDPTIMASATKADGSVYAGGWTNQTVTVSFVCDDVLSGIAAGACPADVVVGSDTPMSGEDVSRSVSDRAGNSKTSNVVNVKVDKTQPTLGITDGNAASATVCGGAFPQKPGFAPSDALSGLNAGLTQESWITPDTASGVGTYKYKASATDVAGNTAYYPGPTGSDYQVYTVVYGTAAIAAVPFLQPINGDGTSRFKLGSTVPVKFQATCNGVPVSNVVARMYVAKGDNVPDPGVDEAISTAAATTGNLFRWTGAPDNQYIFNLSTKLGYTNPGSSTPMSFVAGTWTLKIGLDDGSWRSVNVQIAR